MTHFIQLNLQSDDARDAALSSPRPEGKLHELPVVGCKRLNRIVNKAARKAATRSNRSESGIFSK
jgi:hypothetical protein